MDALENILSRRSIRSYSDRQISSEDLTRILRCGMSGPSCANARDWTFIVVRDRTTLEKMAGLTGKPGQPLKKANAAVMVCGDLERAFKRAPDYWIIDGAIAAQNMVLAAHALGIGSVWLGTYPQMERVRGQSELFNLPANIIPHSIIAFGYPNPQESANQLIPPTPAEMAKWESKPADFPQEKGAFEPGRVHYENW